MGFVGRKGAVIRLTFAPLVYGALFPGALGYAIVWQAQRGVLNLGSVVAAGIVAAVVTTIVALRRRSS